MIRLALIILLSIPPAVAQDGDTLGSENRAIIQAQRLVDAGELAEAQLLLSRAVVRYPDSDTLKVLYGQALWESRDEAGAERMFMEALRDNPLNTVAQTYIEVIRRVREYQVSEQQALIEEVAFDKFGDVVVLAMGFFLGTLLSGSVRKFNESRFVARSKRLFVIGQYDDFADMLEIQLGENNLRPLRASLSFMLDHKSMQESEEILAQYVNSEDNLRTLLRMIKLGAGTSNS